MKIKHILRTIGAAAAIAAISATGAAPAQAATSQISKSGTGFSATSCPGTAITSGHLVGYSGGKKLTASKLTYVVYYSSVGGGTNCIKVFNKTGKRLAMSVILGIDGTRNWAKDTGNYTQYAGAVGVRKTKYVCVAFNAWAVWNGVTYRADRLKVGC